jgi:hypothetical protein
MKTKICLKCNVDLPIDEFVIYNKLTSARINVCKKCKILYNQQYNEKTSDIRKKQKKEYREKNNEIVKQKKQKYYFENKEKIRSYKKGWEREKRKNDILFKLKQSIRHRVYMFLKRHNISKKNKTMDMVGCESHFLKEYLEQKFQQGMSWDNYGVWHIDHIIPLSSANSEEEIYKLCHYTNLQPLWGIDNIKKSNKILVQFETV